MREILDNILAKESLSDTDINILVKNIDLLTIGEKVRLGLIPAPKEVVEVKEVEPEVVTEPVKVKRATKKK